MAQSDMFIVAISGDEILRATVSAQDASATIDSGTPSLEDMLGMNPLEPIPLVSRPLVQSLSITGTLVPGKMMIDHGFDRFGFHAAADQLEEAGWPSLGIVTILRQLGGDRERAGAGAK